MTAAPPGLDGFLVVDKPAGWTSFDVVARARRLLGERKIGHAGTLDPAATGVLPLAVGSATKTLEYLVGASKSYLAEVVFGVETDSFDVDGRVTVVRDASGVTADAVADALPAFRGDLAQIPPMHSAIKIGGQKLYDLARRGEEIERAPRPVTIFRFDLLHWDAATATATLWIDCSKGTYIRSLARDLGAALGPGAYLGNLVRYRTGPFTLCEAVTMGDLAALAEEGALPWVWPTLATHPDAVVLHLPALLLDADGARRWRQGNPVAAPAAGDCRAYDETGTWLGIGRADAAGAAWRPAKVIPGGAAA